ncbi:MAG: DUF4382 domain-containing protein [Armatimonadetes bacterium]|nr:DUF4382 domain-containing protein [Armatimonadota bacterium]
MKRFSSLFVAVILAAILSLAGCGGSSSGGSSGSSFVALYATDSMDGNDHVWVTLYKVALNTATGSQVVFDEPAGRVIDLKTLRDGVGAKFQMMSVLTLNAGTYTSASITMSKDVMVFPAGAQTGVVKQFADQFDTGTNQSLITFTFPQPQQFTGAENRIVLDFDLANWTEVGGKIVPVIKLHDDQGMGDQNRHVRDDHEGVIAGLAGTAPNQEFNLVTGGGRQFHVKTSQGTVIFNNGPEPNPALANGERVHVRGIFDANLGFMSAVSVMIQSDENVSGEDMVRGQVSNLNAVNRTFDISVREADGFVPVASKVHVVMGPSVSFRLDRGILVTSDEFFATIAMTDTVEAEGTYDSGSNTLTAVRIKMDDDDGSQVGDGHNEIEGSGAASEIDAAAGTFAISLTKWEGFAGSIGRIVRISTNGQTTFKDKHNQPLDKTAFFNQLGTAGFAEVRGSFEGDVLIAKRAKLEDN